MERKLMMDRQGGVRYVQVAEGGKIFASDCIGPTTRAVVARAIRDEDDYAIQAALEADGSALREWDRSQMRGWEVASR